MTCIAILLLPKFLPKTRQNFVDFLRKKKRAAKTNCQQTQPPALSTMSCSCTGRDTEAGEGPAATFGKSSNVKWENISLEPFDDPYFDWSLGLVLRG